MPSCKKIQNLNFLNAALGTGLQESAGSDCKWLAIMQCDYDLLAWRVGLFPGPHLAQVLQIRLYHASI